ncbi:hypothetical protein ACFQYP_22340 [Nonomuraea antimicrobica]
MRCAHAPAEGRHAGSHGGARPVGGGAYDDTGGVVPVHGAGRAASGEGDLAAVERDVPDVEQELVRRGLGRGSRTEPQGARDGGIDDECAHVHQGDSFAGMRVICGP